ncbi:pancreatic secretory granule membrane major glycoprotein GP2-like [Astyanax mexicanus]|uniref:pancreatic secretory granule membrane major glycoprotein GP2-like n=1 Tax=Astyanax mexicanus TaxID=7994 RepID=UPI0020CB10F0|nr:pancreatic secretory granule membrane major glycoprotein GP2-like [Astyanax mexicanus]XP_049335752.1 pancreatic secretory granule membrane major glycoprotein GP2-like [Astyanax mexicanus]
MTSLLSPALLITIISMISLSFVISDPCYNYTVLDDPWRSTNVSSSLTRMCDQSVKWSGWYRLMLLGQDVRMPESCVGINLCGTDAPLWLSGIHPELLDGIVTREVCGNWNSDCCHFKSTPIRVKACPGVYYVYEFVSPSSCYLTYCADISTAKPAVNFPAPIKHLAGLRMRLSSANDVTQLPNRDIFVSQFKDGLVGKGLPRNITVQLKDISTEKKILPPKHSSGTC